MSFYSDASASEVIKRGSNLTIEYLRLELESRPSKWLTKDVFVAATAVLGQTREGEIRSLDRCIEARLKYADCVYKVNLPLAKCRMSAGVKKEKKKENEEESK